MCLLFFLFVVAALSILSLFSLEFELEAQIQEILDESVNTPERIALIEETIEKILEIEEFIELEQNSPNFALIKADVLEWQGGGNRTTGMERQRLNLLTKLSNLLGLEEKGILWRQKNSLDIIAGWVI